MLNHIWAIMWKQLKDTLKNKEILIQFVMFPVLTVVMEKAIEIEDMPEHFFANLFAVMYIGMAPLVSMAAVVSEEKEKNTLRVLQMCNVKAFEYLIGNAVYIICMCMMGSLVIGLAGGYSGSSLLALMGIMFFGHVTSVLLGAAVGVISKNQMMATSLTVPVMMVLSFLPMLSMFNEGIKKVARFIYSEQLHLMMSSLSNLQIKAENIVIILCNAVLVLVVFVAAYKKAFVNR